MVKKWTTVRTFRRRIPIASRHTYHERKTKTHQIVEQDWPYCDVEGDCCATIVVREWLFEDETTVRAIIVTDDDDMDWDYDVSHWDWHTCCKIINQLSVVTPSTFEGLERL